MRIKEFLTNDRAVSPVVGVALLIAITVILAAVIGGVVLGIGTGGVDTPQAQLQADFDQPTEGDMTIEHNGGEPLPADQVVVELEGDAGTEETLDLDDGAGVDADGELTAGNSVEFERADVGDEDIVEVTILWEDPNSDSTTVLETFEA